MERPYIVVFTTTTIDGRIASKTGYSKLSCPIDFMRLHKLRSQVDAVMIGARTAIVDDPSLRLKYFKGKNPLRIVVDGSLKIPLSLRLVTNGISKTIVITSSQAPRNKVQELKRRGIEVIVIESPTTRISLSPALQRLYELGIRKILVEGGGELIWSLIHEKLVDEFRITAAPYIFGGIATPVIGGSGLKDTSESPIFEPTYVELCACGKEVHVVYRVIYR